MSLKDGLRAPSEASHIYICSKSLGVKPRMPALATLSADIILKYMDFNQVSVMNMHY